jgi:indolepyruvate ferredoxin oxidoreductase, beta subunit
MTDINHQQPLCILIAALGGEGGGVLMNWIVDAGLQSGLAVQATSVPGVAQRTGSTSYYIEMSRTPLPAASPAPVFALVPMPARVDCVIASELVEAARMMERGFVSPKRTTLITSTSRVLTTAEKMPMGDGRFDSAKAETAAKALSQRLILLDLEALARHYNTMISATLFGALAASGVLPFDRARCEAVMGDGRGAQASRGGFAAAFEAATHSEKAAAAPADNPLQPTVTSAPVPAEVAALGDLPPAIRDVASLGFARAEDYQDRAYAELYVQRVKRLLAATPDRDPITTHALEEAARRLALWMTYEDIPRVAELKTKPDRFAGIRRDAEMQPDQILLVAEYLKPGAEEIAAMLPASVGARMMARVQRGKSIPFLGRGLTVSTTSVTGYAVMRLLARFKSIRRRSLRFQEEHAAIEHWMTAMEHALPRSPAFASALAELPRVLKGYGETHVRGRKSYARIFEQLVGPSLAAGREVPAARELREAIAAALADPEHTALNAIVPDTTTARLKLAAPS